MISKILHTVLAFTVLLSSAGIVVNQHFCKNQLKSSSLFLSAENCHDAKKKFCPNHMNVDSEGQDSDSEKNCCDEKSQYVHVENDQVAPSQIDLSVDLDFVVAFVITSQSSTINWEHYLEIYYELYKPPPIFEDLVIEHQSILC